MPTCVRMDATVCRKNKLQKTKSKQILNSKSQWAMLLSLAMLCTAGCSGCNQQSGQKNPADEKTAEEQTADRKKKLADQKKKKPPFEIGPLAPQLSPLVNDLESDRPRRLIKPGHWTSTVQPMKANYDDFVGRSTVKLVGEKNEPLTITNTPFMLSFSRPVLLAKGRKKFVEGEMLVPGDMAKPRVHWALERRDSLSILREQTLPPLAKMPSYQYFFVVLAKEPGRYGFLKVTDAVRAPWEGEDGVPSQRHYQLLLVDATKRLPLSANVLTWTSLAYLIWDEVDPSDLSPGQQQALVDWLHWGGRLIVNGPDSLDTLRGSFLDKYLPADSDGPRSITAATLQPWNAYWTRRTGGKNIDPLIPTIPWSAVRLRLRKDASEIVGTAKLFYERSVGRGSILVSGIQLTQRDLVNWPGFDSFLNAAILRRPHRHFSEGPYGGMQTNWAEYRKRRLDAHFTTSLRFVARDAATKVDRPGGIGSWSDFSPVANAARGVLSDAAAVRVPGASFVVVCLAVYLIVLVPLNWLVFHTLRRVEWAWIAAPLIAVLGTFMAVHLAQLDIGFVRSQTEIGVLELAGDYPRGHLSRYTALYTSLSTTYDLKFDNQSAVATPFPASQNSSTLPGRSLVPVAFVKHQETQLQGLAVSSATTNMVHSEQMIALDGPLRLGESSQGHRQVENRTGIDLSDVMLIHRSVDTNRKSKFDGCWLGKVRSGTSAIVSFPPLRTAENGLPFAAERKQAALADFEERMDLDPLLKIALQADAAGDPHYGVRDQYLLLARVDKVLPGTQIDPAASQTRGSTLLVAHLHYGPMPKPQPDVNGRKDVVSND